MMRPARPFRKPPVNSVEASANKLGLASPDGLP